ncbi:OmpA family protein [Pedobacter sp. L105]|uniref:OmpA family protein n=1 Tax=Pedobacter sp. L105 TaxID=1641871 RepID=UPI00131CBB98|nr:OmpA family protein [Pedobacter sp. L105]
MAFDLNKNDGSVPDSTSKIPTKSKFDLSKGDVTNAMVSGQSTKSKMWIVGLVGILVVGGGIWYYSSLPKTENTGEGALSATTTVDSSTKIADSSNKNIEAKAVPADTAVKTASVKPIVTETPVAKNTAVTPVKTVSDIPDVFRTGLNHKIPVTFNQGASSFKKVDQSLVRRIISYLTENPAASIHINGYASSDGSLEINQTISQARADAFKKYLVTKAIAESRVVATGKGIEDPIASNETNAGRKKNRRVEITLP